MASTGIDRAYEEEPTRDQPKPGRISAPPSIHHQKGPGRGAHGGEDHEGEVPAGAAVPVWLTGELRCGRRLEEAAGSAARGTGEEPRTTV